MEVQLSPEQEKRVNDMVALTGRSVSELVSDALAGYMDELADARIMLDSRYDDIKSGKT